MKHFRNKTIFTFEDIVGPDLLRIAKRLRGKGYELGYVRTPPGFVPVLHVRRDGNCAYLCRDTSNVDANWLVVFACVPHLEYGRGLLVSVPGTNRDPQTDDEVIEALGRATEKTIVAGGGVLYNSREDTEAWRSPYFVDLPRNRQEERA